MTIFICTIGSNGSGFLLVNTRIKFMIANTKYLKLENQNVLKKFLIHIFGCLRVSDVVDVAGS